MIRKLLRLTNRRARLLVGLLLAGLFCVQCIPTDATNSSTDIQVLNGKTLGEAAADQAKTVDHLAKTDHLALLQRCLEHYDKNYRDYTCTLVKQERIRGRMDDEQWIDVRFMEHPFSVAMHWTKNAPIGDRVLYVEGKWDNMMLVRPKGALLQKLIGTARRQPDGPDAMKNTLRPLNMFGFNRGMQSLIEVYEQARKAGDSKEEFGGYCKVNGRDTVVLVRYLPPRDDYPAYLTKTYIDLEYLVPILIEGWDWDEDLSCRYRYQDVKFNVGLEAEDFTPKANDMAQPK